MDIGARTFRLNATFEAAIVAIVWGVFNLQIVNATLRTVIGSGMRKKKKRNWRMKKFLRKIYVDNCSEEKKEIIKYFSDGVKGWNIETDMKKEIQINLCVLKKWRN